MQPDTSMRYLARINERAWRVVIKFSDDDIVRKQFADSDFGGKVRTLEKARRFRDQVLKDRNREIMVFDGNGGAYKNRHANNKTGSIGVSIVADNKSAPRWATCCAKVIVDGTQIQIAFAIKKYGYAVAWKRAALARMKHHPGSPVSMVPPEPAEWLKEWAKAKGVDDEWISDWKKKVTEDPEGRLVEADYAAKNGIIAEVKNIAPVEQLPSAPSATDLFALSIYGLSSETHAARVAEQMGRSAATGPRNQEFIKRPKAH